MLNFVKYFVYCTHENKPLHFIHQREDESLIFDRYHKPSYSRRYLNFFSNHPISQKKDTIIGLVNKAILLSNVENHTDNLKFIINILFNNNYSLDFIFNTINKRIQSLTRQKIEVPVHSDNTNSPDRTSWFIVPYIPSVTKKFKQFNSKDTKVGFYSTNKLQKFIKVQKDPCSHSSKTNVVYKVTVPLHI